LYTSHAPSVTASTGMAVRPLSLQKDSSEAKPEP